MDESAAPLRRAVGTWLILQLVYNAVMLTAGLLVFMMLLGSVPLLSLVIGSVVFACTANAFFLLGPVTELYLLAYGVAIGRWRPLVFGLGLVFSLLVVGCFGLMGKFQGMD